MGFITRLDSSRSPGADRDRPGMNGFPGARVHDVKRPKYRRPPRRRLMWECLEERIAPAITFQFDYSLDSLGFFTANPAAETVLQEAAQIVGSQINDNLLGFSANPDLNEFWDSNIPNPSNVSTLFEVRNLTIPANTLVVYVGGCVLPNNDLAESNPGSLDTFFSQDYSNLVHSRGLPGALASPPTDWAPWGGTISFNTNWNWSFSGTGGLPGANQPDFLTVCVHELDHLLGYGQAPSWFNQVNLSTHLFDGPHAEADYGGPVPVDTTGIHWADGTVSGGSSAVMDPSLPLGLRRQMTPLDWAGLADIGWNVDQLAVTTAPPSQITPGGGFGLTVTAEDPTGAEDTLFDGDVTLTLASNPEGAILGGTVTATAVNGVATFSGLTLNQIGTGYTLQASSGTLVGATTTAPITVASGVSQLVVATAPPNTVTAGAGFGLTIDAETGSGAVDPTFNGTVTLTLATNPGGATFGGTLTATAVNGVATFAGLTLDKAGGGYTLTATAGGPAAAMTGPITVIHATATQLAITTEPPAVVTAGVGFGLVVTAWDAFGNVDTTFTGGVTLTILTNPGGAALGGTATLTSGGGVATFAGLTLNKAGGGYALQAMASGLTAAASNAITVSPAAAAQLVVTTQPPANVLAGTGFSLVVAVEDSNGNVITSATNLVTLSLGSNPGGSTLGGSVNAMPINGLVTFNNLTLSRPGTGYLLNAASSGLTTGTTAAFNVSPAAATQWVVTTQPPSSATAGSGFSLTVAAEDGLGNVVTTYGGSVSLALAANPGGATLGGASTGTAQAGVMTFTGLTLNKAALGYTLAASGGSLTAATTNSITIVAAPASQWVITTQPPASVTAGAGFGLVVAAEDSFGNVAPSYTGSVSLALASNPGGATLSGRPSRRAPGRRGVLHRPRP